MPPQTIFGLINIDIYMLLEHENTSLSHQICSYFIDIHDVGEDMETKIKSL